MLRVELEIRAGQSLAEGPQRLLTVPRIAKLLLEGVEVIGAARLVNERLSEVPVSA